MRLNKIGIFCLIAQLICLSTFADPDQDQKKRIVTFSGSSKIYGQFSNRQGLNQYIPPNYLRLQLTSTLSVWDIPITGTVLLSNGQLDFQQNLNFFTLQFDYQRFIRSKAVQNFPFLKTFRTIEIGTCRPAYSELIFSGIPLRGINMEWNPGLFYLAGTAGKTLSAISAQTVIPSQKYEQRLYFVKTGIGRAENTHFYVSYLHGYDVKQSIQPSQRPYVSATDTFTYQWGNYKEEAYVNPGKTYTFQVTPEINNLLGAELLLDFFKSKCKLYTEFAGMLHTRDANSPLPDTDAQLVEWLQRSGVNLSSHIDYAWKSTLDLKLRETRLNGQVRQIGPGFLSMGVPYIRNDLMDYRLNAIQFFHKKRISLNAGYRFSFDNLINTKPYRTSLSQINAGLNLRYPKRPWIQTSFSQYHQSNNSATSPLNNISINLTATTGHNYLVNNLRMLTTITYSYLDNQREYATLTNHFSRHYIKTTQTVRFKPSVSSDLHLSLNQTTNNQNLNNYYSAGIKSTFNILSKYDLTGGLRLVSKDWEETKLGFSANIKAKIKYIGEVSFFMEQNFVDYIVPEQSFNEFIARFSLIKKW